MQRTYQSRNNVTKTILNRTRCTGRMPQISELFVAVAPVETAVTFILEDGSLSRVSFLSASPDSISTLLENERKARN